MHKPFYASGFLYNLKSQQILLLQSEQKDNTNCSWSMLSGEGNQGEDASTTFQRIISELLDLKLHLDDIHPIYDYFNDTQGKVNYVFYAEVKNPPDFNPVKQNTLCWVTFSDTIKLPFLENTKQDVVVGERVISLKRRIAQNIQPISFSQ